MTWLARRVESLQGCPQFTHGTFRPGYDPSVTLGSLARALLRVNYDIAQFPLQLVEDVGMSRLDERAPLRLAYENVLVTVDRAAGRLLDDEAAAARACALCQRTTAVRVTIALEHRRAQQRWEAEKATRMARMEERERHRQRLRDAKVVYLIDHHHDRPSE